MAGIIRSLFPSPFTIAVVLTLFTFVAAHLFTIPADTRHVAYFRQVLDWWQSGIWNPSLLTFALQMMLMLLLGHVLALSRSVDAMLDAVVR